MSEYADGVAFAWRIEKSPTTLPKSQKEKIGRSFLKALLLEVSWIESGPMVQVEPLESIVVCQAEATAPARNISTLALTIMTSPHRELTFEKDEKTGALVLLTGAMRREVARIDCSRHE